MFELSVSFLLEDGHWLWAFFLNFVLISISQQFPILTKSGWCHAGILGTVLWGCLGFLGWVSVAVYLCLGFIVTKIGFSYKQSKGIAEGRGGLRGPENVWGAAATGAILAISYQLLDKSWEQIIFVAFAASFAAKLADTFGSEVGKRWGKKTFLISSLKPVPPGTEGAISFEGTLASLFGSLLMALVMYQCLFITTLSTFLIVIFAGLFATLLESFIGAIFQDKVDWLTNEIVNTIQTTISAFTAIVLTLFLG